MPGLAPGIPITRSLVIHAVLQAQLTRSLVSCAVLQALPSPAGRSLGTSIPVPNGLDARVTHEHDAAQFLQIHTDGLPRPHQAFAPQFPARKSIANEGAAFHPIARGIAVNTAFWCSTV